jgi:hypothetical protein
MNQNLDEHSSNSRSLNNEPQQVDMRSGESLRDLYYQSPYLRRAAPSTPFSKDSDNKENVSPYDYDCSNQMNA